MQSQRINYITSDKRPIRTRSLLTREVWENAKRDGREMVGAFVCVYITCKCMHLYCLRATLVVLNQLKFNLHWCSVFLSVCLFVCQSVYLFLLCHVMILSFLFVCVRFCCWFFSFVNISLFCFVSPLSIFFKYFLHLALLYVAYDKDDAIDDDTVLDLGMLLSTMKYLLYELWIWFIVSSSFGCIYFGLWCEMIEPSLVDEVISVVFSLD